MDKKEDDIIWANWLRATAIVAVIILHVGGELVILNNLGKNWHVANLIVSFCRFCVPVFLMLTGSFLLSNKKDTNTKSFLVKRMKRVIYPAIFWGIIYCAYNIYTGYKSGNPTDINSTLNSIVFDIKYGPSFQYWYIYTLLGIYLAIPLLNKWIKTCDEKDILYLISLWFIGCCISIFDTGYINAIFRLFIGLWGFVIVGYYLFNKDLSTSQNITYYSLIGFILSSIGIAIITFYLNKNQVEFNGLAYEYLFPFVIVSSISIYVFFKYSKLFNKNNKLINMLATYSYALYLNHILILNLLKKISLNYNFSNSMIIIPVISILCIVLSVLSIYILSKIPYIKRIIGI